MTRWRYSKQPGGAGGGRFLRPRGVYGAVEHQSVLKAGNHEIRQATIERWDDGVDALEARFAKARAKTHAFMPMGKLPSCERCGSSRDDRREDGTRIHTNRE